MNNTNAPTAHQNKTDRFRAPRMLIAGFVIVAVTLFMVAQVVNADAPANTVSALRSIVPTVEPPTPVPPTDIPPTTIPPTDISPTTIPPTARPRVTPKPVLPKTGAEVEAPAQDNNSLATVGIVALGLALVAGGVVLSRMSNNRKSDSA